MNSKRHLIYCFVLVGVLILQSSVWAGHRSSGIYNRADVIVSSDESTGETGPVLGYYTLDALRVDGNPWTSGPINVLAGQDYAVAMDFTWHVAGEGDTDLTTFDAISNMLVQILAENVMSGQLIFTDEEADGVMATFSGNLLYGILDGPEGLAELNIHRLGTDSEAWAYDVMIENPVALEDDSELPSDETTVPVPSAMLLLGAGLAGVARFRRRMI